jgi:ankyrin repeat protein
MALLLAVGADANAHKSGTTALHMAVLHANRGAVALLIGAGADVNSRVHLRDATTPCYLATMMGDVDHTLALLLAAGADVNVSDARGTTPCHWAARGRRSSAALALLVTSDGANVDAVNGAGETPSHMAASNENAAAPD